MRSNAEQSPTSTCCARFARLWLRMRINYTSSGVKEACARQPLTVADGGDTDVILYSRIRNPYPELVLLIGLIQQVYHAYVAIRSEIKIQAVFISRMALAMSSNYGAARTASP